MKTISIIVAAYNMEEYLGRCLDSVVDHKWDDSVEVIVVNDGSKDDTLQIARQYQSDYPQIVTVIDKENGHYGSCINAAIPVAKGKYVKLLDADDRFDTKGFEYLLDKLQTLHSDMVITNYSTRYDSGKRIQQRYCSSDSPVVQENPSSSVSIFPSWIAMHAITYRTELLRKMNYKQSEGICYTDNEWAVYPLFFVNTLAFVNADVYQYLCGRAGQSTDPAVFKRNILQSQEVTIRLLDYYLKFNRESLSKLRDTDLFYRIRGFMIFTWYRFYLLDQLNNDFDAAMMKSLDTAIREKSEVFYNSLGEDVVRRWLPIRYISYWRTHSKRLPLWLRFIAAMTTKSVNFIRSLR
jgi:glycosyltransferase involved in cell wall biosynthesis